MGRWKDKAARNTLNQEVYERLSGMFKNGFGRSRNEDKKHGEDCNYIYTSRTYETYKREAKHFVKWLRENHPKVKHLSEARNFVDSWLIEMVDKELSPYTISTRKAAISKLYGISSADLVKTPSRTREGISRSRGTVSYDKHISAAVESKWADITRSMGLRRAELSRIRGTDLGKEVSYKGIKAYQLHVHAGTKGGKERIALLIGRDNDHTEELAELFRKSGTDKVFGKIPKAYDNHHYRAEYAKRLYNIVARNKDQLTGHDRYVMRKDRAGEVFDRRAMGYVSKWMGHNRVDVIAEHYLY